MPAGQHRSITGWLSRDLLQEILQRLI